VLSRLSRVFKVFGSKPKTVHLDNHAWLNALSPTPSHALNLTLSWLWWNAMQYSTPASSYALISHGLATLFINMFLIVFLIVLIKSIALPQRSARAVNGANGAFSAMSGKDSWNKSTKLGGMGMLGNAGSMNAVLIAVCNG